MYNKKNIPKRALKNPMIILICMCFFQLQIFANDYYATPNGSGNKDGTNWENAIAGANIENFINTKMTGGDRLLLDDNGTAFNNLQISVANGGTGKAKPKIIEGIDKGDGYPLFKGAGRSEGVFIFLNTSVSYLVIKNLKVEDYQYVVETVEDMNKPNQYITIDGLDINNVTDGLYLRDFRNSIIKNCEITYHTKRGIRLRTGCRNLEIIDCYTDHNMGDYGNFPSNQFPVGFEVGKGRHDEDTLDQTNITFIHCEARNCVDDDQSYWNGDGFLVNDKHYYIRFYDCIAYGNADGGWDDKGVGTYYKNCIAVGNGRNFRNWHSGTYMNCLSLNPEKYADGASGGNDNWWFDGQWGDAVVELYHCTSHNGTISSSEHKVQIKIAENCLFSESIDDSWVAVGTKNVYTDTPDAADFMAPAVDYDGHPRDAYNSQVFGPDTGYWYMAGFKPEVTDLTATPESGDTPLDVQFSALATDPDGPDSLITYSWMLNSFEISDRNVFSYTFNIPGNYSIILEARDEDFLSVTDTINIIVTGNYPPTVFFTAPEQKQSFFEGEDINILVDANDSDGQIDSVLFYLDDNFQARDTASPYEYTIPGLLLGSYMLKTRAYDNDGVFVEDSVEINVINPLTLYEISWDGYVDLSWEDLLAGNPGITGYNVYRSTTSGEGYSKLNTSIIDTMVYQDADVENGSTYYYVVTSENEEGVESGYSNEVAAYSQLSLQLDCIDDAHVRDGKYSDENYGTEESLLIKTEGEDWKRFSYIKFDLSSVGSLSKASLRVKSTDVQANFHSVKCYLAANDSWTEETITWNTKPDTNSLLDVTKVQGSQSWIEFDITSAVKAELSKDSMITLVLLKVEQGNPGYTFHSKEAVEETDHPMLYINPADVTSYTISANAGEGGTIHPGGEISIFDGFNQSFTITPDSGYKVEDVLVDNVSQGAVSKYVFTGVTTDHAISVTFASIPTYTITASAGEGGAINPSGEIVVPESDNQTFTITPDSGFEISDVLVDGASVGNVGEYEFTGVSADHTIEVTFDNIVNIEGNQYSNGISVYPNPANKNFTISASNDIFDVEIYSISGHLIETYKNVKGSIDISTSEINGSGIYIIKVINNERIGVKKLIIR